MEDPIVSYPSVTETDDEPEPECLVPDPNSDPGVGGVEADQVAAKHVAEKMAADVSDPVPFEQPSVA